MEYSEKVLDHVSNPRNVGEIKDANGIGQVGNQKCGDIMKIYLKINDNDIIEDVKFQTFGCGAAVATSSMATELVKGNQKFLYLSDKCIITYFSFLIFCEKNLNHINTSYIENLGTFLIQF